MRFSSRSFALFLTLLPACAPVRPPEAKIGSTRDVRIELVRVEETTDDQATAWFRASNHGDAPFTYQGYSPEGPLYTCEVLEGELWQPRPLGWCGTGLEEQVLRAGQTIEFATTLPRNGQSHRFLFGHPPIPTPMVACAPKPGTAVDSGATSER